MSSLQESSAKPAPNRAKDFQAFLGSTLPQAKMEPERGNCIHHYRFKGACFRLRVGFGGGDLRLLEV